MILCLVTDRRRLGMALGIPESDWREALGLQIAGAASAGVDFVQVREPDLEAGELAGLVRSLMKVARDSPTSILVNDRVDVALAVKASGVHLKEQSVLPSEVRRIAPPGFVIGCSVHSIAAVDARKAADFLIAGADKTYSFEAAGRLSE